MIINVTYDASAANAPTGFQQAVLAAVQYWESQISTPVTVNITFGFGSVDGQSLDSGALGESTELGFYLPYAQVLKGLANTATSAADFASLAALITGDPTNGGTFFVTTAQAKALGLYPATESAVDGYVGISNLAAFTYNTSGQAVSGSYDAVGTLEHEIAEVLGRISGLGATTNAGAPIYTPLDLFRYSSAGSRDLTPSSGYFSINGTALLAQFNNPGNGGDAADLTNAGSDIFNSSASPGIASTISATDLEMMDVLGYTMGNGTAPAAPIIAAPNVTPTPFTTYNVNTTIAVGQTLYFNTVVPTIGTTINTVLYAISLGPLPNAGPTPGITLTNAGTIVVIGTSFSEIGIEAQNDGDAFVNTTKGTVEVLQSGATGYAYGLHIESNTAVTNSGIIRAVSQNDQAIAVWGNFSSSSTSAILNNKAGGTISAWAETSATAVLWAAQAVTNSGTISAISAGPLGYGVGVNQVSGFTQSATGVLTVSALGDADGVVGEGVFERHSPYIFTNAGLISVTGSKATAVFEADIFDNSGTIIARNLVPGTGSVGLEIDTTTNLQDTYSYVNSGTISADIAIYDLSSIDKTIRNSGNIFGDLYFDYDQLERNVVVNNTGTIVGDVIFGSGTDTYNGANGKLLGAIYLGSGINSATLGNDGESVFGGGVADTIIGGAGNDFIEIAAGNNTIDGGGGENTLSFADAASAVTVDLGAGTAAIDGTDTIRNIQTVIGSSFNDTLKAGTTAAELIAGSGQTTLIGGAGNDTLVAGAGGDTMTGGGGNNDFVYSAGDAQLVIADFDANGSKNLLSIYGYISAQSVTQQGANTLITLSATDSILLEGVQASSLSGSNLAYSSENFNFPLTPYPRPSTALNLSADYTVASGNILKLSELPVGVIEDVGTAGHPRAVQFSIFELGSG